jgi:Tfp pilus assembly protein PilF
MAGKTQAKSKREQLIAEAIAAAVKLHQLGKLADADTVYLGILQFDPACFDALNLLAKLRLAQGKNEAALALVDQAIRVVPGSADALNTRSCILLELGRHEESLAAAARVLVIAPRHANAFVNRGNALQYLGRFHEALASYEKAIALEPGNVEAQYNSGLVRLAIGDFKAGWPRYELRWKLSGAPVNRLRDHGPQWTGAEPLAGKTVMLYPEQGLGDTLQFLRYVPLVARRAARVFVSIHPTLAPVLPALPGNVTVLAGRDAIPRFDLHCPLLSLPLAFATELATIPSGLRVEPPPERMARWREWLPPRRRRRVGLAWAGSAAHKDDRNRSIPLARLLPVLDDPDTDVVSLQRDLRPGDDAILRARPQIVHPGAALADFADTAATIGLLDLVVTVDTSVAHLAAAMGKPVWIMLPFRPDWRWLLDRDDSPWYPTVRLFRQPSAADWDGVVARVAGEMRASPVVVPDHRATL